MYWEYFLFIIFCRIGTKKKNKCIFSCECPFKFFISVRRLCIKYRKLTTKLIGMIMLMNSIEMSSVYQTCRIFGALSKSAVWRLPVRAKCKQVSPSSSTTLTLAPIVEHKITSERWTVLPKALSRVNLRLLYTNLLIDQTYLSKCFQFCERWSWRKTISTSQGAKQIIKAWNQQHHLRTDCVHLWQI